MTIEEFAVSKDNIDLTLVKANLLYVVEFRPKQKLNRSVNTLTSRLFNFSFVPVC